MMMTVLVSPLLLLLLCCHPHLLLLRRLGRSILRCCGKADEEDSVQQYL